MKIKKKIRKSIAIIKKLEYYKSNIKFMDILKSFKIKEWRLIMMKKRNVMILFSATAALTLAACGNKEQSSSTSSTSGTTKYASEVTHDGTPIKGGTLKYAIVSSSPFSGIFCG